MFRRLKRFSAGAGTVVAVAGVVSLIAAGTASAANITYKAGASTPITYTCTFPGISAQPLAVAANFVAPDKVVHGTAVTPSSVSGTATVSAGVHALLTSVGYDGVRGRANVPVTVTNASPTSATVGNLKVPEMIYPSGGPLTINIVQDSSTTVPTFTAGSAGSATVSMGSTLTAPLEFHKSSNNTWTPFTMNCNLKVTSPAQNVAFSPAVIIT